MKTRVSVRMIVCAGWLVLLAGFYSLGTKRAAAAPKPACEFCSCKNVNYWGDGVHTRGAYVHNTTDQNLLYGQLVLYAEAGTCNSTPRIDKGPCDLREFDPTAYKCNAPPTSAGQVENPPAGAQGTRYSENTTDWWCS